MAADTQHHLDCYAKEGLRTLCVTKKVPDPHTITFTSPVFSSYMHLFHLCVCVCCRL